ncbi:TIM barrel protein [Escherichia coli]|nr:TIM barrel protein [Escherichia coli]EEY1461448.1 TIM barrel protein [Escherichia coli]EFG1809461.1 TIM barrel protein [Escherichia coli]HAH9913008.1 TIM barrel protein [Escherichia coli]HAH9947284.1 TIM barrel protein [Escherichia coli]
MLSKQIPLGIYEKALPAGECWLERLQLAKTLGFDFVEMSVDETDDRLSRLDWSREQRLALVNAIVETGVRVPSMCLSAHRRFPLGSEDDAVRAQGLEIMRKAIQFAQDVGIRVIQLAGNAEPLHTPGIVVYQHGPFAWGKDAHDAVHNAVVMEEVAKMAWIARGINPQLNHIDSYLMNKHFMRKHGPNAYYGQK